MPVPVRGQSSAARPRRTVRGRRAIRRAGAPDRGSMTVELAVIAPGLILLLLLIGAAGRVVESQGHIDGAARDAARAASLAQSPGQADQLALQSASADLSTGWCAAGSVSAQVSGFPAGPAGPGQDVTVTISCNVNMSPFTLLGFRPAMQFTGTGVAPLDPFTCRSATAC